MARLQAGRTPACGIRLRWRGSWSRQAACAVSRRRRPARHGLLLLPLVRGACPDSALLPLVTEQPIVVQLHRRLCAYVGTSHKVGKAVRDPGYMGTRARTLLGCQKQHVLRPPAGLSLMVRSQVRVYCGCLPIPGQAPILVAVMATAPLALCLPPVCAGKLLSSWESF